MWFNCSIIVVCCVKVIVGVSITSVTRKKQLTSWTYKFNDNKPIQKNSQLNFSKKLSEMFKKAFNNFQYALYNTLPLIISCKGLIL